MCLGVAKLSLSKKPSKTCGGLTSFFPDYHSGLSALAHTCSRSSEAYEVPTCPIQLVNSWTTDASTNKQDLHQIWECGILKP